MSAYLYVIVGLWQASVGMSMAHTAAHHSHLLKGKKPTKSSSWENWHITQPSQSHSQPCQAGQLCG